MRKSEAIGCSCKGCKSGKHTPSGHFRIKQAIRRVRQAYRLALTKRPMDAEQIVICSNYFD